MTRFGLDCRPSKEQVSEQAGWRGFFQAIACKTLVYVGCAVVMSELFSESPSCFRLWGDLEGVPCKRARLSRTSQLKPWKGAVTPSRTPGRLGLRPIARGFMAAWRPMVDSWQGCCRLARASLGYTCHGQTPNFFARLESDGHQRIHLQNLWRAHLGVKFTHDQWMLYLGIQVVSQVLDF